MNGQWMTDTILAALLAVLGTIVGSWLGASISRKSSNDLLLRQEKMIFSNSFALVLSKLYTQTSDERDFPVELLKLSYPDHLVAYLRLRSLLTNFDRHKLDEKWNLYTNDNGYELQEEKEIYRFSHLYSLTNNEQRRLLAIKLINELIKL